LLQTPRRGFTDDVPVGLRGGWFLGRSRPRDRLALAPSCRCRGSRNAVRYRSFDRSLGDPGHRSVRERRKPPLQSLRRTTIKYHHMDVGIGLDTSNGSRRATLADEAVHWLRSRIVLGDLAPGAALPFEEIAQELNMSISPVREAIRQLEVLGLVERTPYRGARVAPLSADQMQEGYEARRLLEGMLIRRAAQGFAHEDSVRSRRFLNEIADAYRDCDFRGAVVGNYRFHASVLEPCASPWLLRVIQPVFEVCERYSAALLHLRGGSRPEIQQIEAMGHEQILAACEARDPDRAHDALIRHLGSFEDISLQALLDGHELARDEGGDAR
jgi:DNA-binding GntR family transcriptional regulator